MVCPAWKTPHRPLQLTRAKQDQVQFFDLTALQTLITNRFYLNALTKTQEIKGPSRCKGPKAHSGNICTRLAAGVLMLQSQPGFPGGTWTGLKKLLTKECRDLF